MDATKFKTKITNLLEKTKVMGVTNTFKDLLANEHQLGR